MDYKTTTNHFVSKAKIAVKQLHGLFYKAKICSLDIKLRLFESLVRSVLMYCFQVWGVFTAHSFDVFHNHFLKQLMSLPRFTPNWFIKLETQCKRIEVSYIKNICNFLSKIMCRVRDSLIYQCFNELRKSECKTKMKYNWYRGVNDLFKKYDISHVLNYCTAEEFNVFQFRSEVSITISKLSSMSSTLLSEDTNRMNSSNSMSFYKLLRTHVTTDEFYNTTNN
jgi:hypothetical protein